MSGVERPIEQESSACRGGSLGAGERVSGRAGERARAGRRERRAAQRSARSGPRRNPQPERGSPSRAPRGPHPHSAGQCPVFPPVRGAAAAAAADGTKQDRGGVATSIEEPARPRAPQSRGPGPVTGGLRKGERRRRRRRRGGSGDTMSSPSPGKRRMDTDVVKLIESKHEVTILGGLNEFVVKFYGPQGTPYEGGVWKVRVDLPDKYPFKSPSIGFMNKIFHPNIDEASGTVCLDVINQTWTALYDLTNIFESFLPQLLAYPNPIDPLNGDAAAMYLHRPEEYKQKIKEYIQKYATEEALKEQEEGTGDSSSESSMSDFSEDEAQDMEL